MKEFKICPFCGKNKNTKKMEIKIEPSEKPEATPPSPKTHTKKPPKNLS